MLSLIIRDISAMRVAAAVEHFAFYSPCKNGYYFKFANRSNISNALFPFRYPIKSATLMLGGILSNMWM